MDRITAIQQSLRVFIYGLLGLLPMVGIFPAACALVRGWQVRRRYSGFNPAGKYLGWGMAFGVLGVLLSFLFVLALGLSIVSQTHQSDANWGAEF